jgi:hypothetical protein
MNRIPLMSRLEGSKRSGKLRSYPHACCYTTVAIHSRKQKEKSPPFLSAAISFSLRVP